MAPDPGTVYTDDTSISDDEVLYRVISTATTEWSDGEPVGVRSNAFQDRPEQDLPALEVPATAVSVFLASAMLTSRRSVRDLPWDDGYGVASVTAEQVRAEGQGIVRWPNRHGAEHAMVFALQGRKKSKGQSRRIAKAAVIVLPPRPPEPL